MKIAAIITLSFLSLLALITVIFLIKQSGEPSMEEKIRLEGDLAYKAEKYLNRGMLESDVVARFGKPHSVLTPKTTISWMTYIYRRDGKELSVRFDTANQVLSWDVTRY